MADEGKFNLPDDDILSAKMPNHSGTTKVEISVKNGEEGMLSAILDDSKDSLASDNYIPLSPQWLYAKPAELWTFYDREMRPRSLLGNPTENNQKGSWRSQGNKQCMPHSRRTAGDILEEGGDDVKSAWPLWAGRHTCYNGKQGCKAERIWKDCLSSDFTENKKDWRFVKADNENSQWWHEEERETSSVSGRRDRRKPECRDNWDNAPAREAVQNRALPNSKHRRHETKCDTKWSSSRWSPDEKEDLSSRAEKKRDVEKEEAHTESQTSVSSNCPGSEHDVDSRDKWRPRRRMEFHSGGPMATNRAAPRFGGEKVRVEGLNLGFAAGRGRGNVSSQTSSLGSTEISKIIPGKPRYSSDDFCYPRRKILDLYRLKNLEPAFATMPKDMEESPPLTEVDRVEPLAFVPPDAAEEVVLSSIWKGKITSSGVASNSYDKRRPKNVAGDGLESMDGIVDILPSMVVKETKETAKEVKIDEHTLWGNGTHINMMDGKDVNSSEMRDNKITLENGPNGSIPVVPENNGISCSKVENCSAYHGAFQPETDTLVAMNDTLNGEAKVPENYMLPRDMCFCYVDPQGEIQGPFLGADIISWFERGFYGKDLPVRLADAPEGTPFQNLGDIMAYLKNSDGSVENINQPLEPEKFEPFGATDLSKAKEPNTALPEFQSLPTVPGSKPENLLNFKGQSFHDFATRDEENAFPGRSMDTSHHPVTISSGNAQDLVASSHLVPEFTESGLRNIAKNKSHHLGPLWSELEKAPSKSSRYPDNLGRTASFGGMTNSGIVMGSWNLPPGETSPYQDMISNLNLPQENSNLNRADQLMSYKFEQQNMLPSFVPLNEQALEQIQNHIINQQMANFSGPKLNRLMALRIQQHQQLQLQQQFHQKQKLFLQEQQQKTELDKFSQDQMMRNLGIRCRIFEPLRSNNNNNNTDLEQAILEQRYVHQLQQQYQCRNHPHRHAEPSLEQLVQARFGQTQSLEHQILRQKKLLQSRQSSVKEKRHSNSLWPNNDLNHQSLKAPGSNVLRAPCLDGFEDLPLEKKVELEKSCIKYRFQVCHIAQEGDSTQWMRSGTDRNEEKSKQLLMDILKPKSSNQLAEVVDSTHIVSAKSVSSDNIPFTSREELVNGEKLILRPDSKASSLDKECKNVNGVKSRFESKQRTVKQDGFVATGGGQRARKYSSETCAHSLSTRTRKIFLNPCS